MLERLFTRRIAVAFALLIPLFVIAFVSRGSGQPPEAKAIAGNWAGFEKTVQPFLARNCFQCHDQTEKGDVRLDLFKDEDALVKGLPTVEKALAMLRKHAM